MSETRISDTTSGLHDEIEAKAFWALGHPIRLNIIRILIDEGEQNVGELTDRLPVSQPQVSVHLKCLAECGFTTVRREGRHSYHRVTSPWTQGLLSLIRDHSETYAAGLLACIECAPTALPREFNNQESLSASTHRA